MSGHPTEDSPSSGGADDAPDGSESGTRLDPRGWSRRQLLVALGAGGLTAGGAAASARYLTDPDDATAEAMEEDRARALAEQFAPDLYFDSHEKWFLTDPRPYEADDGDGRAVVDGFTALNEYTREFAENGEPPRPVAFYNAVQYEDSTLAVVQFWMYETFDQFTTNFHWHDWEVLHVFVDVETEEPQLYVASAHGRSVPNNEFLDPDPDRKPSIVAELGAHASGLGVNDEPDRFRRFPGKDVGADITNRALEQIESLAEIPAAYGLPRDEGMTLPFAIPTLDDQPLYDDDRLPDVTREDFIAAELTASSYSELVRPPSDLPLRETGLQFTPAADPDPEADHEYSLEPATAVEHIEEFAGPLLRFEFEVPDFAEDAIAGHLTSTGLPWEQPRYHNPAEDITDPAHRRELANRYEAIDYGGPVSTVAGALQQAVPDEDAPEDHGATTAETETMAFCLLESDPTAVPSWSGAAVVRDVEPGEHRLTVNAPGMAPYSERVTAEEGEATPLGADGRVTLVTNEDAVKVDGDASDGPDVARVAVEDDFGGRQFDIRPDSVDQFALYVHRGGAYTLELRDTDDEPGAYRVNPGEENRRTIEDPQTGKESLASFLSDIANETAAQAPGIEGEPGLDETDGDSDGDTEADDGDAGADDGETENNGTDTDGSDTENSGDGSGGSDGQSQAGEDDDSGDDDTAGQSRDDPGIPDDPHEDPDQIDVSGGVQGLQRALIAVADSADRAAERAAEKDNPGADRALQAVRERLERVTDALERNQFDETLDATVRNRLEQAEKRVEQALETEKAN